MASPPTVRSLINAISAPVDPVSKLNNVMRILGSVTNPRDILNQTDGNGYTPLMYAVAYANLEIVKLLCDRGADASVRAPDGRTAREMAKSDDIKDYLQSKEPSGDPDVGPMTASQENEPGMFGGLRASRRRRKTKKTRKTKKSRKTRGRHVKRSE
jgi:hypothetical protein